MSFKTFGSTDPQPSASSGRIKEQQRKCEKENIKEESIIHNLQVEVKEEKELEERNEINCSCTMEAQCNKCKLPCNHFLCYILQLFC
jgi:hypothetical protein